jgi:DNA-3-methyladenine glycosylase
VAPLKRAPRLRRLRRAELPGDAALLARFLIGKRVVREWRGARLSGRIVETEAYVPGDAACHAFRGETPRNRSLFLERGRAYVYLCYGSSFMLNVSAEARGVGAGVLIRALEPEEGVAEMERLRATSRPLELTRGPGRLAEAFAIGRGEDGLDLCARGPLWLAARGDDPVEIGVSTRIGLTREAHRKLRFYARGSRFLSGPRSLSP